GVRTGSAGWSNGVMLSLQFKAHTRDPWSGEYVSSNGSVGLSCVTAAGRPMEHILIEDCSFSFYSLNLSLQSAGPMSDVFVRRCQILDAYSVNSHSQGFYAHNAAVTLEETVFDHNGWLVQGSNNIQAFGGATMFNHNTYFSDCDECIFRDNIFLRSSSIQNKWTSNLLGVDPVTNIVTEGNLYVDGEIGISMGGNDTGDYRWVTITVTSNIFTNIGQSQPTGRTLGWGIDVIDWSNGLVADNLVIRQTNAAVANVYGINTGTQSGRDVLIRDNTLWGLNGGDALKPNGAGITSITWLRNKVQANVAQTRAANANAFPTGHVFRTNIYYSTRAASDWFRLGSQACSFDQWAQQVGEAGSCTGKVAFVDPDRSVERYNALVGGAQSYTDFIARVRQQSKRTWRPEYTAQAINAWIRDGFRNAGAPLFPSVVINDGATQTFSHTVMLSLSAEDPVPVTMQISESPDFGGAAWTAYTTRWAFTLSPAIGGKTVYARFASGGSNITDTASASIVLVPEPVGVIVAVALAIIARRT
ncbi:hypothetical protein GX586_15555, partial [bacterium]|nr:hypothetical protein [bacterium]